MGCRHGESSRQNQDLVLHGSGVGSVQPMTEGQMQRMKRKFSRTQSGGSGVTLIELMVAMVVLAIGLGALSTLFISAPLSNDKISRNATPRPLAPPVLEHTTC